MKKLSIRNIVIAATALITVLALTLSAVWFFNGTNTTSASASYAPDSVHFNTHPVNIKPRVLKAQKAKGASANTSSNVLFSCQVPNAPLRCYGPSQLRTAYGVQPLTAKGYDGTGSTIVIIDAYQSPTIAQDLATFNKTWGLKNSKLNIITPQGAPAVNASWAGEITLDVEWAHAMAPGATIDLVLALDNGDANLYLVTKYAIDHNLGDVISQSFSEPEACSDPDLLNAQHVMFQSAAKKGITVFASSGDQGASLPTCDGTTYSLAVGSPAIDPLVTAVGGTQLYADTTTGKYQQELVWNERDILLNAPGATGGGYSTLFTKPAYQNGTVKGQYRAIPDVSMDAAVNGGVLLVETDLTDNTQYWGIAGGTSASSPEWAGLIAIADQMHHGRLGAINAKLYTIGRSAAYSKAFHDVVAGNNTWIAPDAKGNPVYIQGYGAAKGWDPTTGWGTPNASILLPLLAK